MRTRVISVVLATILLATIFPVQAQQPTKIPKIGWLGTGSVSEGSREIFQRELRPGGNITGLTPIAAVLAGKRLELLKETIPKLSRVAVLWDPSSTQQWKESQLPARELGLQLYSMEVSSADKYEGAFREAIQARSAALAVTSNALANSNHKRIADLAIKHRLPAIHSRRDFVANGCLMSYGPDQAEPIRRAALYVG